MSHLLARMVQRTRVPLQGVEPLLPARYSPQAAGAQQSRADETTESAEGEGLRSASLLAARLATVGMPVVETLPPAKPLPDQEVFPNARSLREHAVHPAEVGSSRRTQADPPHSSNDPEAGSSLWSAQLSAATDALPQTLAPLKNAPASAQSPALAKAAAAGMNRSEQVATAPTATQRTAAQPAAIRQFESWQKNQTASRLDATVENRVSDVTISIGHVEVRAAQAAARPSRIAFRPQLSLQAFLNQRNRSGHE